MLKHKKSIFFVHPLGENHNPDEPDVSRIVNIMPPLGICSLAAWLEKLGHETFIYDCYCFPYQDEQLIARIKESKADYLGFSTTTSSFLDGVRLAQKIKVTLPTIKIVFGGVHISALKEKLLEDYPVIDFGVVGEGENALAALMESEDTEDLKKIEGLLYRDKGKVVFTGNRTTLVEMDSLPFPAYDKLAGFPQSYLLPLFSYPRAPGTTIVTSRGCPFQCTYCDRSVFGRSYRVNSAAYVTELLQYLQNRFHIKHVNIYDDTFLLNRRRTLEFCELKIKKRLRMTFNCAGRVEQIDADLLKVMKKAGCWMISLGIETGDPALLQQHRSYQGKALKEGGLDLIQEKLHLIKKAGIHTKGLFMLGLPGETEASIQRSLDYMLSLPLDFFNLAKLTPFPGAPLYQNIHECGTFDENWELMNALNFVFIPRDFTKERLEARYKEFCRKFYERPAMLLKCAGLLFKSPHSGLRFLKNLPTFFSFTQKYKELRSEKLTTEKIKH